MDWKPSLAYTTGSVDQELLLRNEYLVAENRILRQQITGRVQLTDAECKTLAEIGKKLGKKALAEVATIVKPATILTWHRKLIAQKFDGSQTRQSPGRPPIDAEVEALILRFARENRSWGYDRIVGALANLGYTVSDQTVGNILKRHGIPPAPERKRTTTWQECIRMHMDVLVATDFFTTEVWTWCGLVTVKPPSGCGASRNGTLEPFIAHLLDWDAGPAGAFEQQYTVSISSRAFSRRDSERNQPTNLELFDGHRESTPLIVRDLSGLIDSNRRFLYRCARWSMTWSTLPVR
jgi:hypothetical protein